MCHFLLFSDISLIEIRPSVIYLHFTMSYTTSNAFSSTITKNEEIDIFIYLSQQESMTECHIFTDELLDVH